MCVLDLCASSRVRSQDARTAAGSRGFHLRCSPLFCAVCSSPCARGTRGHCHLLGTNGHSHAMLGQYLPGVFSSGAAAPLVAELLISASPSAPARRKPTTPTTSDCSRGDHQAGVMGRQPERRHLQDAVKRIASDRLTVTTQAGIRGLAIKGDPFLGDFGPFVTGQTQGAWRALRPVPPSQVTRAETWRSIKVHNNANSGSEELVTLITKLRNPSYGRHRTRHRRAQWFGVTASIFLHMAILLQSPSARHFCAQADQRAGLQLACAQCPCPLRCVAFDKLRGARIMDSAFIPAFILAENNYSLVQSSGLREEGSAHKTAMSIFGSPASSVAQTPSAASRAALGFFEPTLALHAGSHTTTSDFGKPAAGDGRCITRGFSEHLKLTLTALFQRVSS